MPAISSCKDCIKRHTLCHATCPTYLKEKKEHDTIRELMHNSKLLQYGHNSNGTYFSGKKYRGKKKKRTAYTDKS